MQEFYKRLKTAKALQMIDAAARERGAG